MPSAHLLGVLLAFTSAVVWGSGDFLGGFATRRGGRPFPVTALAAFSGLVLLIVITWLRGEPLPGRIDAVWSVLAGACGMLGIASLYRGLSTGRAGLVAPTASVIGSGVTLIAGAVLEGPPGLLHTAGLLIGLAGIWLVSRASDTPQESGQGSNRTALSMAVIAGLSFGGFFVFIAQVERGLVFSPLVLAKTAALLLAVAAAALQRDRFPGDFTGPGPVVRIALMAGLLDAGGNIFYLLAHQYTRLDVAAILASMYPGSTVLLSALFLRERLDRGQQFGLLLCLAALALIAA